jgi:multidrug efflux pump subunit AcrA (membrane-fusion protein)
VTGRISAVLPTVDPSTRRVPFEATLENLPNATKGGEGVLRAGAFVRATVRGGAAVSVLRFPREVLRPGSQDEFMVVENGKLVAKHASFVVDASGDLLVRAGILPEDRVLKGPKAEAKAGDVVEVVP